MPKDMHLTMRLRDGARPSRTTKQVLPPTCNMSATSSSSTSNATPFSTSTTQQKDSNKKPKVEKDLVDIATASSKGSQSNVMSSRTQQKKQTDIRDSLHSKSTGSVATKQYYCCMCQENLNLSDLKPTHLVKKTTTTDEERRNPNIVQLMCALCDSWYEQRDIAVDD